MKEEPSLEDIGKLLEDINTIVDQYDGINNLPNEELSEDINQINTVIDHYKNLSSGFKTITKYNNKSTNPNPVYAHVGDSGFDIRASLNESVTLKPLERKLIPTGLSFELPPNTELQIRPRSGMALKHGITVLNTPGTVDEGYRDDVGIIIANISNEKNIPCFGVLGDLILSFSKLLNQKASHIPSGQHILDEDYYNRIEAIQFTMDHDDGKKVDDLIKSDISDTYNFLF